MGSVKPDRELSRAWGEYSASVRRLNTAMDAYLAAGVPLDSGRDPRAAPAWSAEHVQVAVEARDAWRQLIAARWAFDQLRQRMYRE